MSEKSNDFRREDAYKTLDTINMWINNCDTKASIMIGIIGVVMSIVFSSDILKVIKRLIEKIVLSNNIWCILCLFIAIGLLFVSMLFLFSTISPRIIKNTTSIKSSKKKCEDNISIMFYGEISNYKYDDFCNIIKGESSKFKDPLMNDLVFQIHSAAVICTQKFQKFKLGLWIFFCGALLMIVALLLSYYCL